MLDRTDFDQVLENKLNNIHLAIEAAKAEGKEGFLYPFFIPSNPTKPVFGGFKGQLIDTLKDEGYHVTNFLPGSRPGFHGNIRDMYICWTDQARQQGLELGYEFR